MCMRICRIPIGASQRHNSRRLPATEAMSGRPAGWSTRCDALGRKRPPATTTETGRSYIMTFKIISGENEEHAPRRKWIWTMRDSITDGLHGSHIPGVIQYADQPRSNEMRGLATRFNIKKDHKGFGLGHRQFLAMAHASSDRANPLVL